MPHDIIPSSTHQEVSQNGQVHIKLQMFCHIGIFKSNIWLQKKNTSTLKSVEILLWFRIEHRCKFDAPNYSWWDEIKLKEFWVTNSNRILYCYTRFRYRRFYFEPFEIMNEDVPQLVAEYIISPKAKDYSHIIPVSRVHKCIFSGFVGRILSRLSRIKLQSWVSHCCWRGQAVTNHFGRRQYSPYWL